MSDPASESEERIREPDQKNRQQPGFRAQIDERAATAFDDATAEHADPVEKTPAYENAKRRFVFGAL